MRMVSNCIELHRTISKISTAFKPFITFITSEPSKPSKRSKLFPNANRLLPCPAGKIQITKEILEKRKLPVDRNNKLTIHNLDPVFRDIRDLHLSTAFSVLKQTGQELKSKQQERERMNISEMKEFVQQKLGMLQNQQKSLEIRKFGSLSFDSFAFMTFHIAHLI